MTLKNTNSPERKRGMRASEQNDTLKHETRVVILRRKREYDKGRISSSSSLLEHTKAAHWGYLPCTQKHRQSKKKKERERERESPVLRPRGEVHEENDEGKNRRKKRRPQVPSLSQAKIRRIINMQKDATVLPCPGHRLRVWWQKIRLRWPLKRRHWCH